MAKQEPMDQQVQHVLGDKSHASWKRYAQLAVGRASMGALLRYEVLTSLFGGWPGALGYWLRRKAYRFLFASMGPGVIIGRHVTIRGAEQIHLGRGVALDDNVVLDARDTDGCIVIADRALISRNTIIRARNGRIEIGEGSDIGTNCLLATDSCLRIGKEVLLAAYVYICAGGNHAHERTDCPIIKQGFVRKGGVVIEDDVWIGAQSTVLDGARIETGTIVGAHSLVNRSLPARSMAWGQPARRRKGRDDTPLPAGDA